MTYTVKFFPFLCQRAFGCPFTFGKGKYIVKGKYIGKGSMFLRKLLYIEKLTFQAGEKQVKFEWVLWVERRKNAEKQHDMESEELDQFKTVN